MDFLTPIDLIREKINFALRRDFDIFLTRIYWIRNKVKKIFSILVLGSQFLSKNAWTFCTFKRKIKHCTLPERPFEQVVKRKQIFKHTKKSFSRYFRTYKTRKDRVKHPTLTNAAGFAKIKSKLFTWIRGNLVQDREYLLSVSGTLS